jgi:nucleotide-binding universal stress UspA family protein
MFQRVVVPLDGSELAELALPFAEEMSCLTGAPIHLVRVVDPAPDGLRVYGAYVDPNAFAVSEHADRIEAETYLAGIAKDLIERAFNPSREVRIGSPTDEVVRSAKPGDLLVVASHGRAGLPRLVLGSVAEDVVRRSPVPVLLVHSGHETPERRGIHSDRRAVVQSNARHG